MKNYLLALFLLCSVCAAEEVYVERDETGAIKGVYANPQVPGQEKLERASEEVKAYLEPKRRVNPDIQALSDRIDTLWLTLEALAALVAGGGAAVAAFKPKKVAPKVQALK